MYFTFALDSTLIKELHYDRFGKITLDTNPDFEVDLGFAGGLYDKDTKLTRFGYRDYDAHTGKWTAKDPIGFSGGDTNLYGYVLGDPVGFVDPTGEFAFLVPLVGWAITGYALWNFADTYLGDNACTNPNFNDVLNDAREVGKNVFPPSVTHPGLGIGTKAGQSVATTSDAVMEAVK